MTIKQNNNEDNLEDMVNVKGMNDTNQSTLVKDYYGSNYDVSGGKVKINCGYCNNSLKVPLETFNLVNEQMKERKIRSIDSKIDSTNILGSTHDGFYVSGCGGYYCDTKCQHLYTED